MPITMFLLSAAAASAAMLTGAWLVAGLAVASQAVWGVALFTDDDDDD